jgi:hypothetical protein
MGRVGPICTPFVLQKVPVRAMMDPQKDCKPPQKLIFVCKISGTSNKTKAKCPLFNNFAVPLNAWDSLETSGTAGHKKFFKNREKIDRNRT